MRLLALLIHLSFLFFASHSQAEVTGFEQIVFEHVSVEEPESDLQLCSPLSTSKNKDELGGVLHKSHQELVEKIKKRLPEEGWILSKNTKEQRRRKGCHRIAFVPESTIFMYKNAFGHKTYDFLKALAVEKEPIMNFYKKHKGKQRVSISDHEYNQLALLAAGIYGAESNSGKSWWFYIEHVLSYSTTLESLAVCITKLDFAKCTEKVITSRGPTQIKKVPKVGRLYDINRDNLYDPYLSGIATMGFLIETYKWYKGLLRTHKPHYLDSKGRKRKIGLKDFNVFMTYMYRGDKRQIIKGTATPRKNCYYKRVAKFQKYLKLYVQPKEHCSKAGRSLLDK